MRTLAELFKSGQKRQYKKGQVLMHQGDTLSNLFYIERGFVKIYNILESGDERILVLMGPGDAFPLANALFRSDYELKYFYETMTEVKAVVVEREKLAAKLSGNHQTLQVLLEYITRTNRQMVERLEVLENKSADLKIAKTLPYLIEKAGTKTSDKKFKLKLKLTHQDIANMTGLTRETTSIEIKKLERAGVIKQSAAHMLINLESLPDAWGQLETAGKVD